MTQEQKLSGGIWFTSDNHFHHKGILKYCPTTRDGTNMEELTENMIDRWNAVVKPNHTVYCLGDFCFHKDWKVAHAILSRLNGKINLIRGNHDYNFRDKPQLFQDVVEDIRDYREINIDGFKVVLCHYPMIEWNRMQHGSIMLYGHVHGGLPMSEYRSMDVGIDTRPGMTPYSWEEIHGLMLPRKLKPHHSSFRE